MAISWLEIDGSWSLTGKRGQLRRDSVTDCLTKKLEGLAQRFRLPIDFCVGSTDGEDSEARVHVVGGRLRASVLLGTRVPPNEQAYMTYHEIGHLVTDLGGFPIGVDGMDDVVNQRLDWLLAAACHPAVDLEILACGGDPFGPLKSRLDALLASKGRQGLPLKDEAAMAAAIFDLGRAFPDRAPHVAKFVDKCGLATRRYYDLLCDRAQKFTLTDKDGALAFVMEVGLGMDLLGKVGLTTIDRLVGCAGPRP